MPKVLGMHEIELRPGITPAEYEQFFTKELAPLPEFQGWKSYLLKADRGRRAGRFLQLFEIESVQARDRYFPRPGVESEEVGQYLEQNPEAAAAWAKDDAFIASRSSTDYIVISD
jgi:hypothetical protein